MATRPLWSGTIGFGLVTVPVRLTSAVHPKDIHFHLLHPADGGRVHQKWFCEKCDQEVARTDLVKGFEVKSGHYVTLTSEELKAAAPEKSQEIALESFVALVEIDPIYFEHTYNVSANKGGARALGLLAAAMNKMERVGVGSFVMRGKEYRCVVRPHRGKLLLSTLLFADEVSLEAGAAPKAAAGKELAMAQQLIEAMKDNFSPAAHGDAYRARITALIAKKSQGQAIEAAEPAPRGPTLTLMQALQDSLSKPEKKKRPQRAATARRAAPAHRSPRLKKRATK